MGKKVLEKALFKSKVQGNCSDAKRHNPQILQHFTISIKQQFKRFLYLLGNVSDQYRIRKICNIVILGGEIILMHVLDDCDTQEKCDLFSRYVQKPGDM